MTRSLLAFSLLCAAAGPLSAQTGAPSDVRRQTSQDIFWRAVSGERESARFQEYRDVPSGPAGSFQQSFHQGRKNYLLQWDRIGQSDQYLGIRGGRQGEYRLEFFHDKIPHRFAYDALSLFRGIGTGNLTIPASVRSALAASTSPQDLAVRLNAALSSDGRLHDIWLNRKTTGTRMDFILSDPVALHLGWQTERRDGGRPFFGSFGIASTVEVVEPINYDTAEVDISAEYALRGTYLSAAFHSSRFDNNIGELAWDNPFRLVDSAGPTAYLSTYQAGPARGRLDLYPDNRFSSFTLTGAATRLPGRGVLAATASWGKMRQNDPLLPYTTNTAITSPLNASDPASLPVSRIDGRVDTTLYNLRYSVNVGRRSSIQARYRMYDYDNRTPSYAFPGYVRTDAGWVAGSILSEPISHRLTTTGLEWRHRVAGRTELTLGYDHDVMRRRFREVAKSSDDVYRLEFDHRSLPWLNLHARYEHSRRRWDSYDFAVPFPGNPQPPQLPWLRKYDEANRDRDRFRLLATAYPSELWSVTASLGTGRDSYPDSPFGLTRSRQSDVSLDVDYTTPEGAGLFAFLSRERYTNDQAARQWIPGAAGDPYVTDTGLASPNNWTARGRDRVTTLGAGMTVPLLPERLDLQVTASYARSKGRISFAGPLADNVPNPVLDFEDADTSRLTLVDTRLRYRVSRALSVSLGYAVESYDVRDFQDGAPYVPVTGTGAYNGALLMGTLYRDYTVQILYGRVQYRF